MKDKRIFSFDVVRPCVADERFTVDVLAENEEEAILLLNEKYSEIEAGVEIEDVINAGCSDIDNMRNIEYAEETPYGKEIYSNSKLVVQDPVIEAEENLKKVYGEDYFLIKGSELIKLHMSPNPNNLVLSAVTVGDIRENIKNLGGEVDLDTILNHRQNISSNIDNDRVRIDVAQSLIEIFNDKKSVM